MTDGAASESQLRAGDLPLARAAQGRVERKGVNGWRVDCRLGGGAVRGGERDVQLGGLHGDDLPLRLLGAHPRQVAEQRLRAVDALIERRVVAHLRAPEVACGLGARAALHVPDRRLIAEDQDVGRADELAVAQALAVVALESQILQREGRQDVADERLNGDDQLELDGDGVALLGTGARCHGAETLLDRLVNQCGVNDLTLARVPDHELDRLVQRCAKEHAFRHRHGDTPPLAVANRLAVPALPRAEVGGDDGGLADARALRVNRL